MSVDWLHANALDDKWRVEMVDPHNPDTVLGELSNITGLTFTYGYYTDAIISGEVDTLGDDGLSSYPHARLRIIHEIESEGYSEEIFTGYISDDPDTYSQSETATKYSLISSLGALNDDLWTSSCWANKGSKVLSMLKHIFSLCGRTYKIESSAEDYTFTEAVEWKPQSSILTTVIELANYAGDDVSVDGHGNIIVYKYVAPNSATTPDWELDYDAEDGMIISSDINHTSTSRSVPGRYILEYDKNDSTTLMAVSDSAAGADSSYHTRGYTIASSETVSDFSGGQSELNALAKKDLANAVNTTDEWSLSILYEPIKDGDIVLFTKDGTTRVCLAKTVDVDAIAETIQLTLRGLS